MTHRKFPKLNAASIFAVVAAIQFQKNLITAVNVFARKMNYE
jgi:hypothetical protein